MENRKYLIKLLKKSMKTQKELDFLFEYFKNYDFFSKYITNNKEDIVYMIFKKIKYIEFDENEIIFYKGDKSDYFYIILEGTVKVFIQKSNKKVIDDIKSIQKGEQLKFDFNNNFSEDFIKKYYNDSKLFDKENKYPLIIEVAELKEGNIFGEIGVRNDTNRKAHIITKNKCKFGILSKKNFNKIIREFEDEIYWEDINFLNKYFENYMVMDEVIFFYRYLRKNIIHGKNINIMKQGNELKEIYFLQLGELLINKNYNLNSIIFPENWKDTNFQKLIYNKAKKEKLKNYKLKLNNNILKVQAPYIFGINEYLNNIKITYNLSTLNNKTIIFTLSLPVFLLEFKRTN